MLFFVTISYIGILLFQIFCHFISTDDFQKFIRRNVYFSYKTTF